MTTNNTPTELKVTATAGPAILPLTAAAEYGLFADKGLEVALTLCPTFAATFAELAEDNFTIVYSDFDSLVAHAADLKSREEEGADEGEADVSPPDLRVFMGATIADLSLVVAPDVETYEGLKDRSLALDGLTSGYSFVLYEMLARAGLGQKDFKMVTVGAAAQRWQALKDGQHAGMLATEPYSSLARDAGFRILGRSADIIGPVQARIAAARQGWLTDNRDLAQRFVDGYRAGLDWLRDPANRGAAAALVAEHLTETGPHEIDAVLASLLESDCGFTARGELIEDGVETVLTLRERYGGYPSGLGSASDYVDFDVYRSLVGPGA